MTALSTAAAPSFSSALTPSAMCCAFSASVRAISATDSSFVATVAPSFSSALPARLNRPGRICLGSSAAVDGP